jgi:GNAT superfamily N-acetyltransferase
MKARPLAKSDFDQIVQVIDAWWGGATRHLAHPMFFHELGQQAFIVEENDQMIGFLLGFLTPDLPPRGYVHLVGVHPEHRRRGVGRFAYTWFEAECRKRGCRQVKAITTPGNEGQVLFHKGIGWQTHEDPDYAGPGRSRIVFIKDLTPPWVD